ncbi:MAG: 23S rRNA (adenine(2503)-C(2))-methyltransferase RlmN [Lentisphaeria bacterium]|nr:23S rRNA (adenine(2503)-C(2))-methyltransferase RlmN [Lentisphaeria bacterium]
MDLGTSGLEELVKSLRQPSFRAKQILEWLFGRFANSYDEMTNLPSALKSALAEQVRPFALTVIDCLKDPEDGTIKWLSELEDGNTIETVLIRVPGRTTVCISTQVGCPVRCVFCASGRGGLVRNLTAGEIIDQVILACREVGDRVDNIVVMGMGEPLLNLDALAAALDGISGEDTLGFGARHITISTSGIVPGIRRLAEMGRSWNLALSLHAVNDEMRAQIIPPATRFPLEEIFSACEYHRTLTGRMLTLEYALIKDKNDSRETLEALSAIAHRLRAKVNLIPCNPNASRLTAPTMRRCYEAVDFLTDLGVQATLRHSHGQGILAACGQLRQKAEALSGRAEN